MANFERGESLDSVLADVRRVFKQDGLNGKPIKSAREVLEASKQTLDHSKADTRGLNAAFDKLKKDFNEFVANKNSGGNVNDSTTNEMSTNMDITISSAKAEITGNALSFFVGTMPDLWGMWHLRETQVVAVCHATIPDCAACFPRTTDALSVACALAAYRGESQRIAARGATCRIIDHR